MRYEQFGCETVDRVLPGLFLQLRDLRLLRGCFFSVLIIEKAALRSAGIKT